MTVPGVPRSLRARLVVLVLLLTTLTAAVTGAGVVVVVRDWVYQDAQNAVLEQFESEMQGFPRTPGVDSSTERGVEERPSRWLDDGRYTVLRDGRTLRVGPIAPSAIPVEMRSALARTPSLYRFERRPDGELLVGYSVPADSADSDSTPTLVFAVRPLENVPARLRQLTLLVLAAVALAAVVAGVAGLALSRMLTRPLQRVRSVAARVAGGDVDARLPTTSVTELRDLTESFNGMLDRQNASIGVLRRQEERSRRFVSDVSHELRSPLAALVPAAEVLREESDEIAARGAGTTDLTRAAHLVAGEIDGLAVLLDDLLEMTRLDAGTAEVRAESVALVETVESALAARGQARVRVSGPAELVLWTDRRRVVAVVTNLVGNALRHGAEPVEVVLSPAEGQVPGAVVEVRDRGAGVPAGHEELVFDRLHKAESARSRSADGGAGLGLAIARENARLLGGDVDYGRVETAGGVVTVFRAVFAEAGGDP